jgi:hypothetical protein
MVALVEATEAAAPSVTEAAAAASSALIVHHITLLLSPRPIARLAQGKNPVKSRHRAACLQSAITPPSAGSAPEMPFLKAGHVSDGNYRAAVERWPRTAITLRQGARVIEDSRRTRTASWADRPPGRALETLRRSGYDANRRCPRQGNAMTLE